MFRKCFIIIIFQWVTTSGFSQTWYPIPLISDTVRIYSIYKDTFTNESYVGGDFTEFAGVTANNIIKWNGTQWLPVGDGFNHPVHSITKYKNSIVAAGEFDSSGTTRFKMPIAKWTGGNWTYFDDSTVVVHFLWPNPLRAIIHDIKEFDNRLFAIGEMEHDGPFPGTYSFEYFAVWNDTIWQRGVRGSTLADPFLGSNMLVFQNDLYIVDAIGYDSCSTNGQQGYDAYGVLKYNPGCWSVEQIGIGWQNTVARCLFEFNNSLYIGMEINHPQYGSFVTRYDGNNFYPVGTGLNSRVEYFTQYNGNLCAVGTFTADGSNVQQFPNHIAQWDGSSWIDLPSSCNFTGWKISFAGVIDSTIYADGSLGVCGLNNLIYSATYPNSITDVREVISENHDLSLTINPNPTYSDFIVTSSQLLNCNVSFEMFNILGDRIYNKELEQVESTFSISLPMEIPQGLYLYKVNTTSKTYVNKIVIYKR